MDLAPLLCIIRVMGRPLLLLIQRLLLAVSMISVVSMIFAISSISCVDFLVILLLLRGALAIGVKKSSPGIRCLNTYVSNCK
jgi:hypothetical protein